MFARPQTALDEHGLGEIDDGAVGDDPYHGLHEHEGDRHEREGARPTTPALVQIEGDPDGARKDDPDAEAPERPAHVERSNGTERLPYEAGRAREEDRAEARFGKVVIPHVRDNCRPALTRPPAPVAKPRFLRLAPGDVELGVGDAVSEDELDEGRVVARPGSDLPQIARNCSCPIRRCRSCSSACSGGSVSAKKSFSRLSSRSSGVWAAPPASGRARPSALGEPVFLSLASACGRALPVDQASVLETTELGIDLPVARRPEEARRLVDDRP